LAELPLAVLAYAQEYPTELDELDTGLSIKATRELALMSAPPAESLIAGEHVVGCICWGIALFQVLLRMYMHASGAP
jgi:hypothetical protein